MLLNAYGWWKVSQITYIAAFALGGLTALGTGFALAFGRKTPATTQATPTTRRAPAEGRPGGRIAPRAMR